MSKVWKCDICGKIEPRTIRHLITSNPDVRVGSALNSEKYYAFNILPEDFCGECETKLERGIAQLISKMKKEAKEKA